MKPHTEEHMRTEATGDIQKALLLTNDTRRAWHAASEMCKHHAFSQN